MNKKEAILRFKVGDPVTGLYLSDLKEDVDSQLLNRKETITEIIDDGNGYFHIKTDFTAKKEEKINEENAKKGEDDDKINLSWYINAEKNDVKVVKEIKNIDLSSIDATLEGDEVVFDNIDIPISLFHSLDSFVTDLETKEINDIIDVEKEVTINISGRSFTPSMIKHIIG